MHVPTARVLPEKASNLLKLARQEFGTLTNAEEKLFRAATTGKIADYSVDSEEENDLARAENWGKERWLNANRIAWLCTDSQASVLVTYRGIWVKGARIDGELDLQFAKISFPLGFEKSAFPEGINLGIAEIRALALSGTHTGPISADGVKVAGGIFLRNGFKAEGEVCLLNASIGGSLSCTNGQFTNKKGDALNADGVKVAGGVVFLGNGFKAEGGVRLSNASIKDHLILRGAVSTKEMTLDLRSAKLGTLWDDLDSWPESGKLFLYGLVYDEIDGRAPSDFETRINWLRRQSNSPFQPQPYEQLSAVLRKSGRDEDAKRILIEKNKDRARFAQLTPGEKCWYYFFGKLIGYGYRPLRAFWIGIGLILVGWVFFGIGAKANVMMPTEKEAYVFVKSGKARQVSDDYPILNPLVYSLDMFVPLIDLRQASYWLPNANQRGEILMLEKFKLPICGEVLWIYLWFHVVWGWILTTLFIVSLTGLIKN